MKKTPGAFCLIVCLMWAPIATALDRPAGLEPDIAFWRKVFSEITTHQGFVHDDQRLDIVYDTITLPPRHTNEDRRRIASAAAQRYAEMLNRLAQGKRTGLTTDERRVLELWGGDVDNRTLANAANRVRFQLGQADRFRDGLARSGLWADYIARTLADAGVPADLIALPHVESAFNPMARSHAGAAGLWQFMPGTGRRFMQVDALLDERLDPYRSTQAAALLLQHNYAVTGSWPTAITAYNHGAAGMQRAIRETGTDDIERIVRSYRGRAFGFASRNFYVSFLAAVDVRNNADALFGPIERLPPDDSLVVVLPAYAPAALLAVQLGVDADTLARMNPSLRKPIWDGTKHVPRGYALRVPARDRNPELLLAAVDGNVWQARQVPDTYHVVQRGETLSSIAPRYGASVNEVVALNGLASAHRIRVGQRLVLPGAAAALEVASEAVVDDGVYPGETDGTQPARPAIAARAADTVASTRPALVRSADAAVPRIETAPARSAEPTRVAVAMPDLAADPNDYSVSPNGTIKVHEGESLGHYAHWLGLRTQALRARNGLGANQTIRVGTTLRLDFSATTPEEFERRRVAHHRAVQERFFGQHRIAGTKEHVIRPGESVWVLAGRRYGVPVWLLRQYNPDLDLTLLHPGTRVIIPELVSIDT
jgi:membrane-bound lytic murein transglycosylase D